MVNQPKTVSCWITTEFFWLCIDRKFFNLNPRTSFNVADVSPYPGLRTILQSDSTKKSSISKEILSLYPKTDNINDRPSSSIIKGKTVIEH